MEFEYNNFETWCQLCGTFEKSNAPDNFNECEIYQVLHIGADAKICLKCSNVIKEMDELIERAKEIKLMFKQLTAIKAVDELTVETINNIRAQFNLLIVESVVIPDAFEDISANDIKEEAMEIESYNEEYLEESENEESIPEASEINQCYDDAAQDSASQFEFVCHVCSIEFPKMRLLTEHCNTEHQCLPQVPCFTCGKVLSSWRLLIAHQSKHEELDDSNVRSFECIDCNSIYKTEQTYKKHVESHGKIVEKTNICAQCGRAFKDKQILRNHEKIHLPDELKLKHPCMHCDKKFINSHCLKIHVARIHDKKSFFFCELCGKGCCTRSDLKFHMDKHQKERLFACDICSQKFKSANSLRIHKKRHFSNNSVKCSICSKEFRNKTALNNHKLCHSDVKKYKCNVCTADYKRLETLKCHIASSHTGVRPFACMWCDRTFVNSANCRKHKLKNHPKEVSEFEAIHGKKGTALSAPPTFTNSAVN